MARRLTSQERRLADLVKKMEPSVRAAFEAAIKKAGAAIDVPALVAALERQDITTAMALLQIRPEAFAPMAEALRAAFIAGATSAGEVLPITLRAAFGYGGNPRAEAAIQRFVGEKIQIMVGQSQEAIVEAVRAVVTSGAVEGVPPARQALELVGRVSRATGQRTGGIIGLNSPQTDAAIRARAELARGDFASYLRREGRVGGRDKNFDRLIRAAQKNGRPLTKTEIDKMVDGYKRKMLNLRGQTIARTETLNALRAGQYDGFKSMVETGVVRDDEMTREWLPTSDNRTREDHSAMAGVIVVGMETPFTLPDGSQGMFPGDSSLPPGQTINCRCAVAVRIRLPERAK